jgi:hypothetical protein
LESIRKKPNGLEPALGLTNPPTPLIRADQVTEEAARFSSAV